MTEAQLAFAREHVRRTVPYGFTENEKTALRPFFSNLDRHVFLVENLPSNVAASMLAMYSRIKNARGLRGVFADVIALSFLASEHPAVGQEFAGDTEAFIKAKGFASLDDFIGFDPDSWGIWLNFRQNLCSDPEYLKRFANGARTRRLLETYLDKYGHNSIARMGTVIACFEQVSTLAAKALEHARVGAGYIELSTRYVDMRTAAWYPVGDELTAAGFAVEGDLEALLRGCADVYTGQAESFTDYLQGLYPDVPRGPIFGEVCDVLANALPAATYTSVGCAVSGEALRSLIKCLLLEGLSETTALAELLLDELAQSGLGQFAQHLEPTPWEQAQARYLDWGAFKGLVGKPGSLLTPWTHEDAERAIADGLGFLGFGGGDVELMLEKAGLFEPRGDHDRLPPLFENAVVRFARLMSFRTWREIQRHVCSSNERTLLTPYLGFYQYDKPMPESLAQDFGLIAHDTLRVYDRYLGQKVEPETLQYVVPLGFNVGTTHLSNLRQMEFLCWQRSGFNVNHEARQVVLSFDDDILRRLPWWKKISRTDRTPAYRFAREAVGVALAQAA